MLSVSIIGFGRFGQLLANILSKQFSIKIHDPIFAEAPNKFPYTFCDIQTLLSDIHALFIAVPIRHFKQAINDIRPYLPNHLTVIDVCSVKVYPVQIMQDRLPTSTQIIATHPLFGPDSMHQQQASKIMMHNVSADPLTYITWQSFFTHQGFEIIEITPKEHDKQAAMSQCLTHLIGRSLKQAGCHTTQINTLGFENLLNVMTQTCKDSWELFYDLQCYNPYSKNSLEQFQQALNEIITQCEK